MSHYLPDHGRGAAERPRGHLAGGGQQAAAPPARPADVDRARQTDFNGDQFADVAVGAPGEKIGTNAAAGATYVLRGSAGGLVGTSAFFYQGGGGLGGGASASDRVGAALD